MRRNITLQVFPDINPQRNKKDFLSQPPFFQPIGGGGGSLYREAQMNKFEHVLKGGIVPGNIHMKNTLSRSGPVGKLKTLPSNNLTKRMTNMDARDNKRLSTKSGCFKRCLLFRYCFRSKINTKTCCLLSNG